MSDLPPSSSSALSSTNQEILGNSSSKNVLEASSCSKEKDDGSQWKNVHGEDITSERYQEWYASLVSLSLVPEYYLVPITLEEAKAFVYAAMAGFTKQMRFVPTEQECAVYSLLEILECRVDKFLQLLHSGSGSIRLSTVRWVVIPSFTPIGWIGFTI
jgi:hypothetical protein